MAADSGATDGHRWNPTTFVDNDPAVESRNKFRLRRASEAADYELRLGDLRVFYRIEETAVAIAVIGHKRGNALIVKGEEYVL